MKEGAYATRFYGLPYPDIDGNVQKVRQGSVKKIKQQLYDMRMKTIKKSAMALAALVIAATTPADAGVGGSTGNGLPFPNTGRYSVNPPSGGQQQTPATPVFTEVKSSTSDEKPLVNAGWYSVDPPSGGQQQINSRIGDTLPPGDCQTTNSGEVCAVFWEDDNTPPPSTLSALMAANPEAEQAKHEEN